MGILMGPSAPIATGLILIRSLRITGIHVGSRVMLLQSGAHFGKIVVRL
ncbi:hypothetical protein [Fibrella aquatilis]|uniref:Uncharacterized protein n=1 Tax=Fibrella aquatilis TaxID=2817059 RepID=A0A939G609_9BACT|nr:hypothetical protein [Fibrella aquatilis]MBO0931050.1 hypothetical protein [Fibrella aquatilis]